MNHLEKIQKNIQTNQILIISKHSNLFWATGFTGSNGIAIISKEKGSFITDSRYTTQAQEQVAPNHFTIHEVKPTEDIKQHAWNQIDQPSHKNILFENEISYEEWKDWSTFSNSLQPMNSFLNKLRLIKSSEEIIKIKQAAHFIDQAFAHIKNFVKPGITEKEIELELDIFLKRLNTKLSFEPIIVSGTNSTKPHGKATDKKIEEGDLVTIDAGAKYQGYCSDMTRTFIVGQTTSEKQNLYKAVLEAQINALNFMKPGVLGKEVDAIARETLKKYNLDQYFGHGLGHSIGIDIHDGYRLNPSSEVVLEENQVWTVEPGAYILGLGGVRIEDNVIITQNGIELLTKSPK